MGYVIGVLPSTLKSYARCVYFQMYSPSTTRYFPKACCRPAWNSLRQPGPSGVVEAHGAIVARLRALITGSLHPKLERTRFSLNGVSKVRAYETRRTVLVGLMLYAMPRRGSTWCAVTMPS